MATSRNLSPVGAALLGAALGAFLTAMLTPMTGRQFRRYLSSIADDTEQIPEAVENASGAAKRAFERTLDKPHHDKR